MKVYNDNSHNNLTQSLMNKVYDLRLERGFRADRYIEQKATYLNKYTDKCGLDTCVIAISGGIDSAVVLGLVVYASKQPASPIKKVIPVLLPALDNTGVTGQTSATERGIELCNSLGVKGHVLNISNSVNSIRTTVENTLDMETDNWAIGQLVPYTRTPFLFYITSLCTVAGHKAIVVGTTNRDEGAYLGYIGKASDGMVDVQLISDIHKSEVYKVAKELDIPDSIINVTPTGDMYDSRCDTEVFGAPYEFVELYLHYLRMDGESKRGFLGKLSKEDAALFNSLATNLENLHRYNRHKYIAHSPAIHLDLWDVSCPDGWINYHEITKTFMDDSNKDGRE